MKRSALLMLLPLLVGCNVHSNSADEDNVTISADENGQVAFNLPFAKGSVKLPEAAIHNGEFDIDGVKMIDGGRMTGFHLDTANDVDNVTMTFTAPQSPDQVRSYFVDQLKSHGDEASLSGDTISGKSKDGSTFTIQVAAAGSGSTGKILMQDKD